VLHVVGAFCCVRQRYTGLTVVLSQSPSSSLVPEAVREVIGGEPGTARADPA